MAHEKEKAQYEEDCKNYERPWELWEISHDGREWSTCACTPSWSQCAEYRRKKPPFTPEYFSSLNWQEALPLVGMAVEFSEDPDTYGWRKDVLVCVRQNTGSYKFDSIQSGVYPYIRTTPETHKHPTVTIGRVELPMPEVEAPEKGQEIWLWYHGKTIRDLWIGTPQMQNRLKNGIVHLAEARAQAWADWWENTVIKAVNG